MNAFLKKTGSLGVELSRRWERIRLNSWEFVKFASTMFQPTSRAAVRRRDAAERQQPRHSISVTSDSRAAATTAWPKLRPPSFGGRWIAVRTFSPIAVSRDRIDSVSRMF